MFRVAPAEASGIESGTVDLITVAQALHWFDIDAFFAEAGRVLKPAGILAVWSYHHCQVNARINNIIERIFHKVDEYWPPERDLVENRYESVTLPFRELPVEDFAMTARWTADDMLAYMRTWSASRRYLENTGKDPVALYDNELKSAWGVNARTVRWPLVLRVGQK